jgi:chromosome segregation ATPase
MASPRQANNPNQHLTIEVNNSYRSNESSGPTPEPSPVGPPKAAEYDDTAVNLTVGGRNGHAGLPVNAFEQQQKQHATNSKEAFEFIYNEQARSFLQVSRRLPSPYSPPPDSLLSADDGIEEGLGQTSQPPMAPTRSEQAVRNGNNAQRSRPPLQEVSVDGSLPAAGSTRNGNNDDGRSRYPRVVSNSFSFEAELQQQLRQLAVLQRQHVPTSSSPGSASMFTAQASPAHQHIHRSQLLPAVVQLKRELLESHQAAFLLKKENEASNAEHQLALQELRSTVARLQEELGSLRQSNSELVRQQGEAVEELKAANSNVRILQSEKQKLEEDLQSSAAEKQALEVSTKEHAQRLEASRASNKELSQRIEILSDQIAGLTGDKEKLTSELQQLKEHLEHEKATASLMIPALQQDKSSLHNDILAAKVMLDRTARELDESRGQVQKLQEELNEARLKLKQMSMDSTQRINELQEQVTSMGQTEREERDSRQAEIDRLKACLKEIQLSEAKITMESQSTASHLQAEIVRLEKSLKSAASQGAALRGEKLSLRKELAIKTQQLQRYESVVTVEVSCQTEIPPERRDADAQTADPIESRTSTVAGEAVSVTDRLGRIRDASDRASLVQEYRREVNRIKAENLAELRKLEDSYNENLARVIQEAKAEVHSQTREYKQKLKAEWDTKVSSLERQHQRDFDQVSSLFCAYVIGS